MNSEIESQTEPSLEDNYSSAVEDSAYESSDASSDEELEDLIYYEQTIRDIAKGDCYQCMICTVEMDHTCKMYACQNCYRVFDYDCIQEWAEKSASKSLDKIWKCPNCNHTSKQIPVRNRPTCWCGKVINPDANEMSPNSCGQTCNAKICEHGCKKFCHLGPHAECNVITTLKCNCGKNKRDIFCYQLKNLKNKRTTFQCDEICNLPLPCGIHKCKRKCHVGLCGACPEVLLSSKLKANESEVDRKYKCYCGESSKEKIKCKDILIHSSGMKSLNEDGKEWLGVFECKTRRTVPYKCKEHTFIEGCQAPPSIPNKIVCPYSPKLLKTCPCGKTLVKEFKETRKKCTDPIQTCENICGKTLKCGKHTCPFTCHNGPCMDPCIQIESTTCSCHQKIFLVPCCFDETPKCNFKCESQMSCRRHRCPNRCCSGKPSADRRKKMSMSREELNDESLVEAVHICLKECNLKLECGIHDCTRKCHPGKCPPCLVSDSNDLACPCGKTVVEAPVRCGTTLPPCPFECIEEYPCGHKPPSHHCHPASENCPPCTATVDKPCKCGKHSSVKALCFQEFGSCGEICNKQLENCSHKCQYKCHEPGHCQPNCQQICNKDRVNCDHKCKVRCHGSKNCPDIPCEEVVKIVCECGRQHDYKTCGATSVINSNSTEMIPCNEECEKYLRHIQLREAFGLNETLDSTNMTIKDVKSLMSRVNTYEELGLPYSQNVISVYSKQPKWCSQIEDVLKKLVLNKTKNNLHFKPMKPAQRNFIRDLSGSFNFYSESQDPEPKRSVFIKRQPNTIIPNISLEEAESLWQGFKKMEKEKKALYYESTIQREYINFQPKEVDVKSKTLTNGFLIEGLTKNTTEDDLKDILGQYLKPTLLKNVCYTVLSDNTKALIYPGNYTDITESVHQDLEALVGHFDFIGKESMIFDSIKLCNVSEHLSSDSDLDELSSQDRNSKDNKD